MENTETLNELQDQVHNLSRRILTLYELIVNKDLEIESYKKELNSNEQYIHSIEVKLKEISENSKK